MRYDFTYVQAAQATARHSRADALARLILAPIIALFRSTKGEPS